MDQSSHHASTLNRLKLAQNRKIPQLNIKTKYILLKKAKKEAGKSNPISETWPSIMDAGIAEAEALV